MGEILREDGSAGGRDGHSGGSICHSAVCTNCNRYFLAIITILQHQTMFSRWMTSLRTRPARQQTRLLLPNLASSDDISSVPSLGAFLRGIDLTGLLSAISKTSLRNVLISMSVPQ